MRVRVSKKGTKKSSPCRQAAAGIDKLFSLFLSCRVKKKTDFYYTHDTIRINEISCRRPVSIFHSLNRTRVVFVAVACNVSKQCVKGARACVKAQIGPFGIWKESFLERKER